MASQDDSVTLPSTLPTLASDPIERRRLLNILTQRRYRRRKQARVQELELELQKLEGRAPRNAEQSDWSTLPVLNERFINRDDAIELCNLQLIDDSIDVHQAAMVEPFPNAAQSTIPNDPLGVWAELNFDSAGASSESSFGLWSTDWTPAETSSCPGSQLNNLTDLVIANLPEETNAPVSSTSPQTVLVDPKHRAHHGRLSLSDYIIATPGLSAIRAKGQIFQHLHGADFQLDVWDLQAISPISTGFEIYASPANFIPTPLQKSVQHHPILDLFPWASFRDMFLYIMSMPMSSRPPIAQKDMPAVTLELMMAAKDSNGGVRVWGSNPFCAENWEIGQVFYSRFWWAIDTEIIQVSNRLRSARGERPLCYDMISGK